jgi:hypothetical protein
MGDRRHIFVTSPTHLPESGTSQSNRTPAIAPRLADLARRPRRISCSATAYGPSHLSQELPHFVIDSTRNVSQPVRSSTPRDARVLTSRVCDLCNTAFAPLTTWLSIVKNIQFDQTSGSLPDRVHSTPPPIHYEGTGCRLARDDPNKWVSDVRCLLANVSPPTDHCLFRISFHRRLN